MRALALAGLVACGSTPERKPTDTALASSTGPGVTVVDTASSAPTPTNDTGETGTGPTLTPPITDPTDTAQTTPPTTPLTCADVADALQAQRDADRVAWSFDPPLDRALTGANLWVVEAIAAGIPPEVAWNRVAYLAFTLDVPEVTRSALLQAAAIVPWDAAAMADAAFALAATEAWDLADLALACALELAPDDAPAHATQAYIARKRDLDDAAAAFATAAAVVAEPRVPEWRYQAANLTSGYEQGTHLAALPNTGWRGIQGAAGPVAAPVCCRSDGLAHADAEACADVCGDAVGCDAPCAVSGRCDASSLEVCVCPLAEAIDCTVRTCLATFDGAEDSLCVSTDGACVTRIDAAGPLVDELAGAAGGRAVRVVGRTAVLSWDRAVQARDGAELLGLWKPDGAPLCDGELTVARVRFAGAAVE